MRPTSSNSASCPGRMKPGVVQAASSSASTATRKLRTGSRFPAPGSLGTEALQRLLQRVVLGTGLEGFLPDAPGFLAVAERPQHFAQVRADLAVGPAVPGAPQLARGALQVAHAVQHPAERVDDEKIRRRDFERLIDQLLRLGQAQV